MVNINAEIFRAYDIRGIVDQDLTVEAVEWIGKAIGSEAKAQGESTIIIGRDGRLSGPSLIEALATGILSTGCNVIDLGLVTTPMLYFATHILETHSGVMLTGSHNPPNYNGLKVVIQGETLADKAIQGLYERIVKGQVVSGKGERHHADIFSQYIKRITSDVRLKKRLKIVIDCGNGVGSLVAPTLFREMGCDVYELFCKVDGHFPNHPADPSEPKNMQDLIKAVVSREADVGLAFDGDADRLGVVTHDGQIIFPDRYLMLFVKDVLSRKNGARIVYDVKCTKFLRDIILENGGEPDMYKTGHSFMKQRMKETGAELAGEMSGHMFFKERWYGFDDGIYAGARLLEILSKKTEPSSQWFKELPQSVNTPELKLPIADDKKFAFMDAFVKEATFPAEASVNKIDGIRVDFKTGFGLIRPSNTTPYLILRFEADTEAEMKKIEDLFRAELLKLDPTLKLPF